MRDEQEFSDNEQFDENLVDIELTTELNSESGLHTTTERVAVVIGVLGFTPAYLAMKLLTESPEVLNVAVGMGSAAASGFLIVRALDSNGYVIDY